MAYATVEDLIQRFGQQELIRLTTPADEPLGGIVVANAELALIEASAKMDSYIRKRYRTPMDVAPPEIAHFCCDIARYDLSTGEQKTPSEETRTRFKDAMDWLRDIANGKVTLELDEVSTGTPESGAMVSDRSDRAPEPGGCYR